MAGVKVMVCVCYTADSGGSAMLTRLTEFEVAPVVGDQIELVPERKDEHRHVSEWHERVEDRWLHTSQERYNVEVHVRPAALGYAVHRRIKSKATGHKREAEYREQALADLREAGYS